MCDNCLFIDWVLTAQCPGRLPDTDVEATVNEAQAAHTGTCASSRLQQVFTMRSSEPQGPSLRVDLGADCSGLWAYLGHQGIECRTCNAIDRQFPFQLASPISVY